jgi:hypothetical protein
MGAAILDSFPTIKKAVLLMAYDNGCINRASPEEKVLKDADLSLLFAGVNRSGLEQVEIDLAQLTEEELQTFCAGDQDEAETIWRAKGMLLDTRRLLDHLFEAL